MGRLLQGTPTLYLYLAGLLFAGIAWHLGQEINLQLAAMPVKQVPRIERAAAQDVKTFYPAWIGRRANPASAPPSADVETAFREQPPRAPDLKPAEPNYADMFMRTARIDGVADDGVFVSGRFYPVTAKMPEFAMTAPTGKKIVPVVAAIKDGRVTFSLGPQKAVFVYGRS